MSCTCNKKEQELFWRTKTDRYLENGELDWSKLFPPLARLKENNERIFDSTGFRRRVPGECQECYDKIDWPGNNL